MILTGLKTSFTYYLRHANLANYTTSKSGRLGKLGDGDFKYCPSFPFSNRPFSVKVFKYPLIVLSEILKTLPCSSACLEENQHDGNALYNFCFIGSNTLVS